MEIKVIISWLIGSLFYINGFNYLWALFFPSGDLEIIRQGGYYSFWNTRIDTISSWLYFISALGLIGLISASVINYLVSKKLKVSAFYVIIVFVIAYFINKPLMSNFQIFGYHNSLFKNASMHVFFVVSFFIVIMIGTIFLIFPLYFRYFKFANPGGTVWVLHTTLYWHYGGAKELNSAFNKKSTSVLARRY